MGRYILAKFETDTIILTTLKFDALGTIIPLPRFFLSFLKGKNYTPI